MANEKQGYLAYLVRLWRVTSAGRSVWRGSLEDAHTGERRVFADLDALFAFFKDRTTDTAGSDNARTAKGGHIREEEKPGSEPCDRQNHRRVDDPSQDRERTYPDDGKAVDLRS